MPTNKDSRPRRNNAEWYDFGTLVSKEANGLLYEVIANGTFACTAPNGDRFKGDDSAEEWLVEHGITDDEQLNAMLDNASTPDSLTMSFFDGWEVGMNRWFDLIVYARHKDGWMEIYHGDDPLYEYDEDLFNDIITEAIAKDAKKVSE